MSRSQNKVGFRFGGNMIRRVKNPWGANHRPPAPRKYFDGECEGWDGPCDCRRVKMRPAQTSYPRKEGEPDPNPDLQMCDDCWDGYFEYWQDMWAEYYAGRM